VPKEASKLNWIFIFLSKNLSEVKKMIKYSEIYANKDKDLREKLRDSDWFILFSDLWRSPIQKSDKQKFSESKFTFWSTNNKLKLRF